MAVSLAGCISEGPDGPRGETVPDEGGGKPFAPGAASEPDSSRSSPRFSITPFEEAGLEHTDVLFQIVNPGPDTASLWVSFLNITRTSAMPTVSVNFFTPEGRNQSERFQAGGPIDMGWGTSYRSAFNIWLNEQGADAGPSDAEVFEALGFGYPTNTTHDTLVPPGEYYMVVGLERARADLRIVANISGPFVLEEVLRDPNLTYHTDSVNHEDWAELVVAHGPMSGAAVVSTEFEFSGSYKELWVGVLGTAGTLEVATEQDSCRSTFIYPQAWARDIPAGTVRVSVAAAQAPYPLFAFLHVSVIGFNVPLPHYVPEEPEIWCWNV